MEVIQTLIGELHMFTRIPFSLYSFSIGGFSNDFGILLSKMQAHRGCLCGFLADGLSFWSYGGAWLHRSPLESVVYTFFREEKSFLYCLWIILLDDVVHVIYQLISFLCSDISLQQLESKQCFRPWGWQRYRGLNWGTGVYHPIWGVWSRYGCNRVSITTWYATPWGRGGSWAISAWVVAVMEATSRKEEKRVALDPTLPERFGS